MQTHQREQLIETKTMNNHCARRHAETAFETAGPVTDFFVVEGALLDVPATPVFVVDTALLVVPATPVFVVEGAFVDVPAALSEHATGADLGTTSEAGALH